MQNLVKLLQVIASPAYFFDKASHRVIAVNPSFISMMQYDEQELLRMRVEDFRPVEDLARLQKTLASSPPQGKVEWRYRVRSGELVYVRLSYRDSTYFDKQIGRRHDIRLVVISNWDTKPLQ